MVLKDAVRRPSTVRLPTHFLHLQQFLSRVSVYLYGVNSSKLAFSRLTQRSQYLISIKKDDGARGFDRAK